MKKALGVIGFLFTIYVCMAQANLWTTYKYDKYVYAIEKCGNILYAGTNYGLVVCNTITGEFVRYTSENSPIQDNYISSMQVAPDSSLWIGAYQQVLRLDGTTWTTYDASDTGITDYITSIAFEQDGTGWFGSSYSGLVKFDGSNWTHFNASNSGLRTECIYSLKVAPDGDLWVGTDIGLYRFNGRTWTHYNDNARLPAVSCITFDNNGLLWCQLSGSMVTQRSVVSFDGVHWAQSYAMHYGTVYNIAFDQSNTGWLLTSNGLMVNTATGWETSEAGIKLHDKVRLLIDENDIKWMGTRDGLFRINGLYTTEVPISENTLHGDVNHIALTGNNTVWVGGSYGLSSFDGINWDAWPELRTYFVTFLLVDSADRLWLSDYWWGVNMYDGNDWATYYFNDSGLPNTYVYDAAEGINGAMWFRTMTGLAKFHQNNWTEYDAGNTGLPLDEIDLLTNDAQGNLWMTINDSLLVKYNGVTWTPIIPVINGQTWQFGNWQRRMLFCDSAGNVWMVCSRHAQIGGYDFCLVKYNGTTWTTVQIPGLWSYYINCMYEDNAGNLWFGTDFNGLYKLTGTEWTSYEGDNSFLNSDQIEELAADSNGKIWMVSDLGLTVFDYPASIADNRLPKPPDRNMSVCCYPNPFRTEAKISFKLQEECPVRAEIFNIKGQRVRKLVNQTMQKGLNDIRWDGKDDNGKVVSAGIYFCRLKSGNTETTARMVMIK